MRSHVIAAQTTGLLDVRSRVAHRPGATADECQRRRGLCERPRGGRRTTTGRFHRRRQMGEWMKGSIVLTAMQESLSRW